MNKNKNKKAFGYFWLKNFKIKAGFLIALLFLIPHLAHSTSISSSVLINLTNQERINHGLKTLTVNPQLTVAAQKKAEDMIKNNYFNHQSPSGKTPWDWLKEAGYEYKRAGENLAVDFTQAESVVAAWMESSTHRENVLNPHFEEIGLAAVSGEIDGRKTIVSVQFFGQPAGEDVLVIKQNVDQKEELVYQPSATPQPKNNPALQVLTENKVTQEEPKEEKIIVVQAKDEVTHQVEPETKITQETKNQKEIDEEKNTAPELAPPPTFYLTKILILPNYLETEPKLNIFLKFQGEPISLVVNLANKKINLFQERGGLYFTTVPLTSNELFKIKEIKITAQDKEGQTIFASVPSTLFWSD